MRECPNGCDLEEHGGTHQGLPDCDLLPSNPDHPGREVTNLRREVADLVRERDELRAKVAAVETLCDEAETSLAELLGVRGRTAASVSSLVLRRVLDGKK